MQIKTSEWKKLEICIQSTGDKSMKKGYPLQHLRKLNTHTHTHTHIYIYIYIHFKVQWSYSWVMHSQRKENFSKGLRGLVTKYLWNISSHGRGSISKHVGNKWEATMDRYEQ